MIKQLHKLIIFLSNLVLVEAVGQDSPCTSQQTCQPMDPAGTMGVLVCFLVITAITTAAAAAAAPETSCTHSRH